MECFLPYLVLVSRLIFNNCFSRGCFSHSEQPTGSAVCRQNLWFHPDTRMWRFCKTSTATGYMTPGFRTVFSLVKGFNRGNGKREPAVSCAWDRAEALEGWERPAGSARPFNNWTPRPGPLGMRLAQVTQPELERTQILPALVSPSYTHLLPLSSGNHSRHY